MQFVISHGRVDAQLRASPCLSLLVIYLVVVGDRSVIRHISGKQHCIGMFCGDSSDQPTAHLWIGNFLVVWISESHVSVCDESPMAIEGLVFDTERRSRR